MVEVGMYNTLKLETKIGTYRIMVGVAPGMIHTIVVDSQGHVVAQTKTSTTIDDFYHAPKTIMVC